jgi:hypothetical protein
MKPRKTHLKSRTGCATCRARRIKCDESKPQWYVSSQRDSRFRTNAELHHSINCTRRQVRCDFLGAGTSSQTSPGDSTPQMVRILHALSDSDADTSAEQESESLLKLFPTDCPDFSKQERFLMAHLCGISDSLVAVGMDTLDFGLSIVPEFVTSLSRNRIFFDRDNRALCIAVDCAFVRNSACGLAATHLALLTQSSSIVHLAYYYKCLALRGLRESLRVLNKDNVDAMLAASYLLSWQASQR